MDEHRVSFHEDPAEFLALSRDYLDALGVAGSVVRSGATRMLERAQRGERRERDAGPLWFATVQDGPGAVVGAAIRTVPYEPYPPYVPPMPGGAARCLAAALRERGEAVTSVHGASPAAEIVFTACTGRRVGDPEVEVERLLLHEVTTTIPALPVPGALRRPRPDETDLLVAWLDAFMAEADVQAGRRAGSTPTAQTRPEDVHDRVSAGRLWVWDVDGAPVHVTGIAGPDGGVARIGPVYTPPEHRGQGYASNAVGQVSQLLLDDGNRVCLFTDVANPTSNAVYERLGYVGVMDAVQLRLRT